MSLQTARSLEESDDRLIRGTLGQPESVLQTAPRSVQPLWQVSRLCPTDRQTDRHTDHATSVTIYHRINALRA